MKIDSTATSEDMERFLELFKGDVATATAAIRAHTTKAHLQKVSRNDYKPSGPVLISVKDLEKTYKIGRQPVLALRGVSFDVHEGEFIALTGSSGSGKSTLLQLIGGLDQPSKGSVTIDGVDLTKMSDRKLSEFRGETIGFVFQFFYLQPFLSLGTNIEVPGMFARQKRQERIQQTDSLARAVKLEDRINHLPKELSGGQMQRAAIARALFNKPKVLLADEPTGNLDSTNGAAIIDLFEYIRREFGTTIVVVTHDQSIARRADRELKMSDGMIV